MTKSRPSTESVGCRRSASGPEMKSLEGKHQSLKDGDLLAMAAYPVSNLELVRRLQDSKALRSRKIEDAYDFIINQENGLDRETDIERATVKAQDRILIAMPQFVSFLSEWVQSAVLWSSKPQQLTKINENPEWDESHRVVPAHLDARYWAILRWCLSSGHLHKFASVSPSIMRPLNLYVITLTETMSTSRWNLAYTNKLEDSVRSVEILLLANERSFRPDLDHWVSLASTALSRFAGLNELAIDWDGKLTSPVRLIACILEGFARFVSIHPNRRKIFTTLTENLLESLLIAHATLRNQSPRFQSSSWLQRILQTLEEILEKGLFHAVHVGSFQDVCTVLAGKVDGDLEPGSTEKKRKRKRSGKDSNGDVDEEDKDIHLSYHRLLFKKLDSLRSRGIEAALLELGWIFETYSRSFKTHQAAEDVDVFGIKSKGKPQALDVTTNDDDDNNSKGDGSAKPVHDIQLVHKKDRNSEASFNVFAEFIGPLVKDLKSFHLSLMSSNGNLSYQHINSAKVSLAAVAGLLKAAKNENTYVPTEDSTTQAHFSFLESCFNTLVRVGKSLPRLLASTGAKVPKNGGKLKAGSPRENTDEHIGKTLFADILREMITALKYLIELNYRVVENSLRDVWIILLAEVALQQASRGDPLSVGNAPKYMKQEAIEVACHIINIFSDLRQVDQALFSLCVTLRRFMSQGPGSSHPGKQSTPSSMAADSASEEASWLTVLNLEAIEFLVCAKPLLLAISAAMRALPEGQVAEFLRLLTVDALESITLIDISDDFKQEIGPSYAETGKKRVTVGLKALVELYRCVLENVNIVGTNSVQAGKAVRQFLLQIVTPKLVELIDFFTLSKISEDDSSILVQTNEKTQAIADWLGKCDSADSRKTLQDDSLLNTWVLVFLLRLYITTQSLHGECISLMPPNAAKKASAALDGPPIDYLRGDITDILTHFGSASFLSGVGRGAVKVSHFLAGIERRRDLQELTDCPPLGYSLDCVAIQSLAQLSRQIEAVSFLLVGRKDVRNVMSNGSIRTIDLVVGSVEVENEDLGAAKFQKRLQKLLKDLKKEGSKLSTFLLKGVGWQEDNHDAKLILGSFKQSWDLVVATLTVDTLPIQRWNLVSKSFDIWAKYAAEEDLRKFIVFLFSSSSVVQSMKTASEDQKKNPKPMSQEDCRKKITDDLLCNALFYEEESFCRIFPSTFVEELKKLSLSAFGKWPFESYTSNSFLAEVVLSQMADEWSDCTRTIEAVIGVRGQEEAPSSVSNVESREPSVINHTSEQLDVQLQDATPVNGDKLKTSKRQRSDSVKGKPLSNQSEHRWSDSRLNALDRCVGLLGHISALPSGYIKSSECAICAYTLLCFERLLMSSLLDLRATTLESPPAFGSVDHMEVSTVFKLLKAFSTCRSALLALTSSDTLNVRNANLTAVLAGRFSSIQWLSISIHAAAICLVDSLTCSNLLAQEKKDIMASGKCLLYEVLISTASLVTYVSEETFIVEARKRSLLNSAHMAITTKAAEENAELISPIIDSEGQGTFLIELIDYQVEMVDQFISSSFGNELNFAQHQGDGCDNMSGIISQRCFGGLALSSSLASYFWSLEKFAEEFVKESTFQNRPLVSPIPSMGHAQKLSIVLTETLLSALVPAGSHAILLLGEHEVDRIYNSGEKKIKLTVVNQAHEEENRVTMMGAKDEDEDEDDEEVDLPTGVQAAETSGDEQDEHKDVEEMEIDDQKESSLPLQMHDLILKEEFGKHESVTQTTEVLYTMKSVRQRSLLENMLQASCSNKCEIIGELYLALAGTLKLESINLSCCRTAIGSASSPDKGSQFQDGLPPSVNLLMGAGYWLLMKAAEDTEPSRWSHWGWLIGLVKYMDAVFCLMPHMKPPLPPLAFSKLFDMHIRLLGSLTPSEDQFHSFKLFHALDVGDEQGISIGQGTEREGSHNKDTKAASPHSLRTAVRESLGTLLRTASRHHSVLALQSIMRALVGQSDSNQNSGLEICGLEDGRVGRGVAAGIECLSIAMEVVSGGAPLPSHSREIGSLLKCQGTKRLRLLANHLHEFLGAIFNIMEYVQGPHLFLIPESLSSEGDSIESESGSRLVERTLESGPVILQALQILITTASRDIIFPMKACHVALALHCPARLFWPVYCSGLSKLKFLQKHLAAEQLRPQKVKQARMPGVVKIGTKLGVKLYVSCCRLLCSIIRHHRRESGHCIALLGDSARVLLHCLETPNWPSSDKGGAKDWSIKMAAYCASWLRRIYEEMGEHKETLGKYCSHFLSDYLSVLSGHGPHAAGFIREVEAALQPGAYVLVDACSANDLQQLHASLGEGPRRNALLNLRRKYQLQFKYTGKV